jgi:hypothetical protein
MSGVSFRSRIKKLEQKSRVKAAWKEGDEVKTEREHIGYGVLLERSLEWLIFAEPPDFQVGDQVEVIIRKVEP